MLLQETQDAIAKTNLRWDGTTTKQTCKTRKQNDEIEQEEI